MNPPSGQTAQPRPNTEVQAAWLNERPPPLYLPYFIVFAGDTYYPGGGLDDLRGTFQTIEEAREFVSGINRDWKEIAAVTLSGIERVA